MLRTFQKRETGVRIFLGVFIAMLGIGLLAYLVPTGPGAVAESPETVARVGDYDITVTDVRRQLQRLSGQRALPKALESLYARQVLEQLVFEQVVEMEAKRLGLRVTDEELADRIRRMGLAALSGGTFAGSQAYEAEVQSRFNMSVAEFEDLLRKSLLEDKFRRLVTDGLTASEDELKKEFVRQYEKVKIEFVVLKPEELESKITPSTAELSPYFEKNKSRYQLGERRAVRYVLLDSASLRAKATPSEDELRAYFNEHIERFRVQNRAKVSHILFKTTGKTDAEVQEIRKKAEGVLKQARSGKKFEDLAKQYSEDTTKDKGGDLGWIEAGQTVPEFEKTAFTLSKGAISDLVQTQFGLHIIYVQDRELARTKPLEEVRGEILPIVTAEKADRLAEEQAAKLSAALRQSGVKTLDDIAKQFQLSVQETRLTAVGDPFLELGGKNAELESTVFRLSKGQMSSAIRTDRGYVVVEVNEISPARQAELDDVREKVLADYRKETALTQARTRAEELSKRSQGGEALAKAAKALGFEAKTSDAVARTGSIDGVGSVSQLKESFRMKVGEVSKPVSVGENWVVYRLVERTEANFAEFPAKRKELETAVLTDKRGGAYQAFRNALVARMEKEGKLEYNQANLRRLTGAGGSL